ncbi:universal stress protein [Nocardioides sp. MAHUQ-72]|uniref:universal stress protein n=1 Tax=unclassified Nocardioides TaxID=2615069 RepID=UPI00360DC493
MDVELRAPIVVGVDGTQQGLHAVQFAMGEARRAGCGVRLVHVLPELAATAPIVPAAGFEIYDEVARKIMREAETAARSAWDGMIPLEKVTRTGRRVHVLVKESENARMVVLGHRDRTLLGRVFTASTTTGVATWAHCPVVCIPMVWQAGDRGQVVVGVEDPRHAHEVLSHAFVAASARGARLRVLHTWKLQRPYDEAIVSAREADEWTTSLGEQLRQATSQLRAAYPDVEVDHDVRHQDPAAALLGATEGADLLVLGRRGHGMPVGLPLGSTTRALIRESRCPVEITPMHPARPEIAADLALTEDELSPQT